MAISQTSLTNQLKEWAPLTDLFMNLPSKNPNGLLFQDVKLTCVDIVSQFVALGTNVGIVYWFDRIKKDMQRLKSENNIPITALKVISTVDYMVACGNTVGNVDIFQIPKSHPEGIPETLRPKNRQVERYSVSGMHRARISALNWSKNGMKLFSGDKNGSVVVTEIDFYMHMCKSCEILNESYEVVQLSYNQKHLLVSTTYRSIICNKPDNNKWKVAQVGTKDRKVLDKFGGIIHQHSEKPVDTILYCSRTGLRIWVADINGNVQKTLCFKDLLAKECLEVPLINPISANLRRIKPQKEPNFGVVLPFNDHLLVTYNNDVVYILDPKEMNIVSTVSHLRGVMDVATHKDEIFILEGDRSLVRLSFKPEPVSANPYSCMNSAYIPLSSLANLSSKLQSTNVIPATPPLLESILPHRFNIHTDDTLVMNAEEAEEVPLDAYDKHSKFDEIGKKDFEDNILYKKSQHKKKSSAMESSTLSLSSNSSGEREFSYTRPTLMNLSSVGVLPDLRSPESIKYDIEYKEKILADVLSLDRVKLDSGTNDCEKDDISVSKNCDIRPRTDSVSSTSSSKVLRHVDIVSSKDVQASKASGDNCSADNFKPPEAVKIQNPFATLLGEETAPAYKNIPDSWGLSNINLNERSLSVKSDESFSDWEIV